MVKEYNMKQTEIGQIPQDWKVLNLEENFTLKARIGWQGLTTAEYQENGDFILVTGTDFQNGYIDWSNCVFVEKMRFDQDRNIQLRNNDVLVTKDGTIGKIAFIDSLPKPTTLNSGVFVLRPKSNNISNRFFYYLLMSVYFDDFLLKITAGSTITHLYQKDFVTFNFVCPPLPEQEAIAEVLNDCDVWIKNLAQIIEKKRLVKRGAMQELLKPKGDWEEITLIDIADKKKELFNDGDWIESEHIKTEGIRLIQTGNIGVGKFLNKENRKYINEKSFSDLKCKELFTGDLLICRLAEPAGRACIFPKTNDYKTVTSVDVTIFRPDEKKYNRSLIMYVLCTDEWFKNVIEQVGGTTHKRISRGNLGLIKIHLPKSLTEQNKIATILSDMDLEIDLLEGKLLKAQKIRQGIMQDLLTGRVRLI